MQSAQTLPFLPCHVTILKSLYAETECSHNTNDNDTNELQKHTKETIISQHTWDLISLYLSKQKQLEKIQKKTSLHSGVHDEALAVSESIVSPHQSKPLIDFHVATNHAIMRNTPVSHSKKRKSSWLSPPSQMKTNRLKMDSMSQNSEMSSSWTFVTKLLEKRKQTSLIQSQKACDPFVSLLNKVQEIIQELQINIDLLKGNHKKRYRKRMNDWIFDEGEESHGEMENNESLSESDKASDAEQNFIAQMTLKVNLWVRLAQSLNLIMEHKSKQKSKLF